LLGDAFVERANKAAYADPIMKKFIDVATETVFGSLWTRPGLDLKTRTLICVVSDAATARTPELGIHLRMARRQGGAEGGVVEVLLHLGGSVGVPLVREALLTAKDVFAEMRVERGSDGEAAQQVPGRAARGDDAALVDRPHAVDPHAAHTDGGCV